MILQHEIEFDSSEMDCQLYLSPHCEYIACLIRGTLSIWQISNTLTCIESSVNVSHWTKTSHLFWIESKQVESIDSERVTSIVWWDNHSIVCAVRDRVIILHLPNFVPRIACTAERFPS